MKTKIIYEDDALLVIYKPAGIATQTSKIGQADVVSELKNYLAGQGERLMCAQAKAGKNIDVKLKHKELETNARKSKSGKTVYLGIIHRLDQPVEGLLVFAKNKAAAAKLSAQLGKGTLHKQYYAVIGGQPSADEGRLVDKLYKNEENRAVVVTGQQEIPPEAKDAVLEYRVLEQVCMADSVGKSGARIDGEENLKKSTVAGDFPKKRIALVDIHIETGRFHQIRAQMAHHGMALLGDAKYGNKETGKLSQQLFVRHVALCAYSLEVVHPVTGKTLSFAVKPEGKIFQQFPSLIL